MWNILARIIIRKRWFILLLLVGLTVMSGFYGTKIKLSRELTDILPPTDTNQIVYKKMRQLFGDEGTVLVVGVKEKNLYTLNKFKKWHDLGNELKTIEGVDSVYSEADMYFLTRDTAQQAFVLKKTYNKFPSSQAQLDSIKKFTHSQPFYQDLLFSEKSGTTLMMVSSMVNISIRKSEKI